MSKTMSASAAAGSYLFLCPIILSTILGGRCDHDGRHGISRHVGTHASCLQLPQQDLQGTGHS